MTEEEAKTKWCPFARVAKRDIPGRSYNRWADDWSPAGAVDGAKCVGSACMAWRNFPPEEWGKDEPPYHPSNVGIQPTDGYCGLAGKP